MSSLQSWMATPEAVLHSRSRHLTGSPILCWYGEKFSDLEQFYPERMASRILRNGRCSDTDRKHGPIFGRRESTADGREDEKAQFDFEDYLESMEPDEENGRIIQCFRYDAGTRRHGAKMPEWTPEENQKKMARMEAMIQSMTVEERLEPGSFESIQKTPYRKRRGCGHFSRSQPYGKAV